MNNELHRPHVQVGTEAAVVVASASLAGLHPVRKQKPDIGVAEEVAPNPHGGEVLGRILLEALRLNVQETKLEVSSPPGQAGAAKKRDRLTRLEADGPGVKQREVTE